MRQILIAVAVAVTVSILLTPVLIRLFTKQGFGHQIREDGPPSHHTKRGTPSMGGVAILAGIWAGYLGAHLAGLAFDGEGIGASGLLVLGLATALGGVGFIDDLIKIRRSRNLGLNKTAKTVGQITSAVLFGVLVLQFRNAAGLTPGSADLSYVREIATVTLAPVLFVLFCVVIVSAWSNAVNFTDDLAGLLAGNTGRIKTVITDQKVIAGIGNAYSDEILHVAKISPFATAGKLSGAQLTCLHEAMASVLSDAVRRSVGQGAAMLKGEKRSGLRVHARTGLPCPVCGDTVREVSFADKSFQYCPTCQTGGKALADRRMSRLLK